MPNYAILRTRKLKTARDLTVASMHNGRALTPPNADVNRADDNAHSHDSSPINQRWTEAINRADISKIRSNAVRGIEILMAYSPDARGTITKSQWHDHTTSWLNATFGRDNILQYDLHMDETTPHAHAIVVPINDKGKLVAKDWLGGREKLSKLQDSFADHVKHLGLERGISGSRRKHTPIAEYHKSLAQAIDQGGEAPQIPEPPIIGRREYQLERQSELDRAHRAAITAHARERKTREQLTAERNLRAASKSTNRELAKQIEANKNEVRQLKQSLTSTDVMRLNGYDQPDRIEGSEHIYHTEQGTVQINTKKDLWNIDWASGRRGSVIDLDIALSGGDFKQSIQRLRGAFGPDNDTLAVRAIANAERKKIIANIRDVPPGNGIEEHYDKYAPDPSKWDQVKKYLTSRLIPESIIETLYNTKKLWANKWGSAVFGTTDHKNSQKTPAVHIRGTRSNFKQTLGPKNIAPFIVAGPQPSKTALVESPIDALALHAMTGLRAITYGGTAYSDANEQPDYIAFDADSHGQTAAARIQSDILIADGYRPRILLPPGHCKDWAETLEQGRGPEIKLDGPDHYRGLEI